MLTARGQQQSRVLAGEALMGMVMDADMLNFFTTVRDHFGNQR